MIVYDVATNVLDTVISSAQHRWLDLWHYIYCFVQSKEAFTVEGNKHTHAQTHTHTHTHTHKCRMQRYCKMQEDLIKIVQPALLPLSPGRASDKKRHSSLFLILT